MVALAIIAAVLAWTVGQAGRNQLRFATWESLEFDSRAAVWLVEQHIAPGTRVEFRPNGDPLTDRVSFALPGTELGRGHGLSAYEKLLAHFAISDPRAIQMGQIVNAIEVSAWASAGSVQIDTIEQSYRWLQQRYNHDVPDDCYRAFFDLIATQLDTDSGLIPIQVAHLAEQNPACGTPGTPQAQAHVLLVPMDDVLAHVASGNNVVFIDVREASEFKESHIPGAINLTLRDIDTESAHQLRDADLVIAYCIKDFRGFEAARKLAQLGLTQVGTMLPYGLAGWHQKQLPVTGAHLDDAAALAALKILAETG